MGFRYRLHDRRLPGTPDLVFARRKKAIFVHGCFWHRHEGCALARLPKSRLDFWEPKLARNKQRDEENCCKLHAAGWELLIVWECEIKRPEELARRLREFLDIDR
jgi:DNA mismatch endonuclease (patch repair protein)